MVAGAQNKARSGREADNSYKAFRKYSKVRFDVS